MTRERLAAAWAFVLAWLSTPTSKAGILTVLTAALGKRLDAPHLEAIYWLVMVGAGVALILWPQKSSPP